MKFTQTGTPNKSFLEENTKLDPTESISMILLEKLDYLLAFLAEEKPENASRFAVALAEKFQGLSRGECWVSAPDAVKEIFAEHKNLSAFLELNKASLNYYIHLLGVGDNDDWKAGEVEIPTRAMIQAWVYPPYYQLETLAEVFGREEAVNTYKRFISQYYHEHPSPSREQFVSLENMHEKRTSGDTTSSGWVLVHAMLSEGKYAFKNENCPTCVDMMVDLPDVEFKYIVCCYGDYAKFRANTNDHIVLTMEHTLMQGDAYCSRVLHDTRVDYDLRHPPKEFWDNFKPGKKNL